MKPPAAIKNPLPQSSRYELLLKIASGGMASVYLGRVKGAAGFWKLRAIKRAHPHLTEDDGFRARIVEEAHLSARIVHPNVVAMQDVEEVDGELLLVMDYIEGASLATLLKRAARPLHPRVVLAIVCEVAAGLAAAHELTGDDGAPLGLVHRDVSPENVLVGLDGIARITDFGIAKCVDAPTGTNTRTGSLKGKIRYMAPEYVKGRGIDARADVFALGVVLWEALAGRPLFRGENELETLQNVCMQPAPRLPELDPALDAVVATALQKSPAARFGSTRELADALLDAAGGSSAIASRAEVGREVERAVGEELAERRAWVKRTQAERSAASAPATAAPEEGTIDVVVTTARPAATERIDALPAPVRSNRGLAVAALALVPLGAVGWLVLTPRAAVPASAPIEVAAQPAEKAASSSSVPAPTPPPPVPPPAVSSAPSPRTPPMVTPAKPPASVKRPDPNPYR